MSGTYVPVTKQMLGLVDITWTLLGLSNVHVHH